MQETQVQYLGQEALLEKRMAIHSSILAWRIPWTEEPGGLQPVGSQRVGHDGMTNIFTLSHIGRNKCVSSTQRDTHICMCIFIYVDNFESQSEALIIKNLQIQAFLMMKPN